VTYRIMGPNWPTSRCCDWVFDQSGFQMRMVSSAPAVASIVPSGLCMQIPAAQHLGQQCTFTPGSHDGALCP